MFNRKEIATLEDSLNSASEENSRLRKLICRAYYEFVPCDYRRQVRFTSDKVFVVSTYLDKLDREREERIQDEILREKVEKIVLALREHKWEPA